MAKKKTLWFTIKQLELEIHLRTEFREVGEDRAHDKASPVLLGKQGAESRPSGMGPLFVPLLLGDYVSL